MIANNCKLLQSINCRHADKKKNSPDDFRLIKSIEIMREIHSRFGDIHHLRRLMQWKRIIQFDFNEEEKKNKLLYMPMFDTNIPRNNKQLLFDQKLFGIKTNANKTAILTK